MNGRSNVVYRRPGPSIPTTNDAIIAVRVPPTSAGQNPSTSSGVGKFELKADTNERIIALVTRENNPKVNTYKGNVSTLMTGRAILFTSVKTTATSAKPNHVSVAVSPGAI